jgi:hypothetical protein
MSEVADKLGGILGMPHDSGSHLFSRSVAPLSAQAQAMLDAEPNTLSAPRLAANLSSAFVTSDVTPPPGSASGIGLAAQLAAPSANAPVEIAAVPTAPISSPRPMRREVPPSAPTIPAAPRRPAWLGLVLFLGAASAGAGVWALLHDWSNRPEPALSDLGPMPDLRAQVPPPDLALQPDLAPPPDMAHPAARSKSHCGSHPIDASCILTPMATQQRTALVTALRENGGVHLCPGERLSITGLPRHPKIQGPASWLKRQAPEPFNDALLGLDGSFPATVEILCQK